MNMCVPEFDPCIQKEMPSLVDQSWVTQVSTAPFSKAWM